MRQGNEVQARETAPHGHAGLGAVGRENGEHAGQRAGATARALRRRSRSGRLRLAWRVAEGTRPDAIYGRDALFRRLLAVADIASAAAALAVATVVLGNDRLLPASLAAPLVVVVLSKLVGLYDRDELVIHKSTLDEAPVLLQLSMLYAVLIWLLERFLIGGALGKFQFLALGAVLFVAGLASRSAARWAAGRWSRSERCILVGDRDAFGRVQEKLSINGAAAGRLVVQVGLDEPSADMLVRGGLRELVEAHDAHRVIIVPGTADSDAVLDLIREAKTLGVKVSLLPRFAEVLGSSVIFDDVHGMTMLSVRSFGLSRSSLVLKRSFDLVAAVAGLLAVAPLLIALAALVKLDSPGPVLFRQLRIGHGGRAFHMLKFRTMVEGADEHKAELEDRNEAVGLFKIADDPRITRVGRFLRRTSLDELPQLLNVVRGEMSLVGPRPLVAEDDERIEGWHRQRLDLKPGMTGHWQVLGASRIPLHEMVALDYLYVANWSIWTDVKLLLRTVPPVLAGRGL